MEQLHKLQASIAFYSQCVNNIVYHSDYMWTSSRTLTVEPGVTEIYNTLNIVNDEAIESTESLTISLTNPQPPDAVLSLGSITIIIINNDFRKLCFVSQTLPLKPCVCVPHLQHISDLNRNGILRLRQQVVWMCASLS